MRIRKESSKRVSERIKEGKRLRDGESKSETEKGVRKETLKFRWSACLPVANPQKKKKMEFLQVFSRSLYTLVCPIVDRGG